MNGYLDYIISSKTLKNLSGRRLTCPESCTNNQFNINNRKYIQSFSVHAESEVERLLRSKHTVLASMHVNSMFYNYLCGVYKGPRIGSKVN